MDRPIGDPLAELITTYNELNSPVIEELDQEPSPLEFMRYVSRNTPFVVREAAATWSATKEWNAQYLEGCLRDQTVNVAVTPKGFVKLLPNAPFVSFIPAVHLYCRICHTLTCGVLVLIPVPSGQKRRRSYMA